MGRGRPIRQTTRLGRMLVQRGLRAYQLSARTDVYSRLMTEYIAGRRVITPEHAQKMAAVLECKPSDIIEPNLTRNLTDITGKPIGINSNSVRDLDMSHLEPYTPATGPSPSTPAHVPNVAPDRLIRKVS